jgi:hypothetical protein
VEANSTGGQGSRRAVAPSDDDDDELLTRLHGVINGKIPNYLFVHKLYVVNLFVYSSLEGHHRFKYTFLVSALYSSVKKNLVHLSADS